MGPENVHAEDQAARGYDVLILEEVTPHEETAYCQVTEPLWVGGQEGLNQRDVLQFQSLKIQHQ